LIPGHALEPFPNGTKNLSNSGFPIQRSGRNSLGSGKMDEFIRICTFVIETGVLRGITQSPYLISVSGARRGERAEVPCASRMASWTQPFR